MHEQFLLQLILNRLSYNIVFPENVSDHLYQFDTSALNLIWLSCVRVI